MTVFCFTLQTVCGAESAPWSVSLSKPEFTPSRLNITLPRELGEVRESFDAPLSAGTIIHIEDAHGSYEAQKNIQAIIRHLVSAYGIKLLHLEGGNGRLEPELLRIFEDPALNLKLADLLMKHGEVTGAEMFLLENKIPGVEGFGTEETEDYRRDFRLFRSVVGGWSHSEKFLKKMRSAAAVSESRIFSNGLRDFLREWREYRKNNSDLLRYIQSLAAVSREALGLDPAAAENQDDFGLVMRVLKLQDYKNSLDADKIRSEKAELISFLNGKIEPSLLSELAAWDEKAEAAHSLRPRFLLEKIHEQASSKGLDYKRYPHFSRYAAMLMFQSEIESELLFREIERLEEKIFAALPKTDEERRLLEWVLDAEKLEKVLRLELSRAEYRTVQFHAAELSPRRMAERLKDFSAGIAASSKTEKRFTKALEFYGLAEKRETHFVDSAIAGMKEKQVFATVMVSGGFHTEGLKKRFKEKGLSYVSVRPRITGVQDSKKVYLDAMLGKSRIEKPAETSQIVKALGVNRLEWQREVLGDSFSGRVAAVAQAREAISMTAPFRQTNPYFAQAASLGTREKADVLWTEIDIIKRHLLAVPEISAVIPEPPPLPWYHNYPFDRPEGYVPPHQRREDDPKIVRFARYLAVDPGHFTREAIEQRFAGAPQNGFPLVPPGQRRKAAERIVGDPTLGRVIQLGDAAYAKHQAAVALRENDARAYLAAKRRFEKISGSQMIAIAMHPDARWQGVEVVTDAALKGLIDQITRRIPAELTYNRILAKKVLKTAIGGLGDRNDKRVGAVTIEEGTFPNLYKAEAPRILRITSLHYFQEGYIPIYMLSGSRTAYLPAMHMNSQGIAFDIPLDSQLNYEAEPGIVETLSGASHSRIERVVRDDGSLVIRKSASNRADKGKLYEEAHYMRRLAGEGLTYFPEVYSIRRRGDRVTVLMEDFEEEDLLPISSIFFWDTSSSRHFRAPALWAFGLDVYKELIGPFYSQKVSDTPPDYVQTKRIEVMDERLAETKKDAPVLAPLIDAPWVRAINFNGKVGHLAGYSTLRPFIEAIAATGLWTPPYLAKQHGDLHYGNIMVDLLDFFRHGGRFKDFKLIDPKYIKEGNDYIYDFAKLITNFYGHLEIARMSGVYGYNSAGLTDEGIPVLQEHWNDEEGNPKPFEMTDVMTTVFRHWLGSTEGFFTLEKGMAWKSRLLFSVGYLMMGQASFHLRKDGREETARTLYVKAIERMFEAIDDVMDGTYDDAMAKPLDPAVKRRWQQLKREQTRLNDAGVKAKSLGEEKTEGEGETFELDIMLSRLTNQIDLPKARLVNPDRATAGVLRSIQESLEFAVLSSHDPHEYQDVHRILNSISQRLPKMDVFDPARATIAEINAWLTAQIAAQRKKYTGSSLGDENSVKTGRAALEAARDFFDKNLAAPFTAFVWSESKGGNAIEEIRPNAVAWRPQSRPYSVETPLGEKIRTNLGNFIGRLGTLDTLFAVGHLPEDLREWDRNVLQQAEVLNPALAENGALRDDFKEFRKLILNAVHSFEMARIEGQSLGVQQQIRRLTRLRKPLAVSVLFPLGWGVFGVFSVLSWKHAPALVIPGAVLALATISSAFFWFLKIVFSPSGRHPIFAGTFNGLRWLNVLSGSALALLMLVNLLPFELPEFLNFWVYGGLPWMIAGLAAANNVHHYIYKIANHRKTLEPDSLGENLFSYLFKTKPNWLSPIGGVVGQELKTMKQRSLRREATGRSLGHEGLSYYSAGLNITRNTHNVLFGGRTYRLVLAPFEGMMPGQDALLDKLFGTRLPEFRGTYVSIGERSIGPILLARVALVETDKVSDPEMRDTIAAGFGFAETLDPFARLLLGMEVGTGMMPSFVRMGEYLILSSEGFPSHRDAVEFSVNLATMHYNEPFFLRSFEKERAPRFHGYEMTNLTTEPEIVNEMRIFYRPEGTSAKSLGTEDGPGGVSGRAKSTPVSRLMESLERSIEAEQRSLLADRVVQSVKPEQISGIVPLHLLKLPAKEREALRALVKSGGNVSGAAELTGIVKHAFQKRVRELGLPSAQGADSERAREAQRLLAERFGERAEDPAALVVHPIENPETWDLEQIEILKALVLGEGNIESASAMLGITFTEMNPLVEREGFPVEKEKEGERLRRAGEKLAELSRNRIWPLNMNPITPISVIRKRAEQRQVLRALIKTRGNVRQTAELTGMSVMGIWRKLPLIGLPTDEVKGNEARYKKALELIGEPVISPETLTVTPLRDLEPEIAELEKIEILRALDQSNGNVNGAIRLLGFTQVAILNRIESYGITRQRLADDERAASAREILKRDYQSVKNPLNLRAEFDQLRNEIREKGMNEIRFHHAVAIFSEATRRTLMDPLVDESIHGYIGGRPNIQQIRAARLLFQNRIGVHMLPSEGKTIAVGLAAFLKALTGQKVEVHAWSRALAARDAQVIGAVLNDLGVKVTVMLSKNPYEFTLDKGNRVTNPHLQLMKKSGEHTALERAYAESDIVYGPYSEMIFHWMADWYGLKRKKLHVRDKPDWVFIEESDTPLLDAFSEPLVFFREVYELEELRALLYTMIYNHANRLVLEQTEAGTPVYFREGSRIRFSGNMDERIQAIRDEFTALRDYELGQRRAAYSEAGPMTPDQNEELLRIEAQFNVFLEELDFEDLLAAAIEAQVLYHEGDQYFVRRQRVQTAKAGSGLEGGLMTGRVVIRDEITSEVDPDKRWWRSIHTFLEIKEGLPVQRESKTEAVMTAYEFYRRIPGWSSVIGVIGEGTEAELRRLYGMELGSMPPAHENRRRELGPHYFGEEKEKHDYIIGLVKTLRESPSRSPILINASTPNEAQELARRIREAGFANGRQVRVIDGRDEKEDAKGWNQIGRAYAVTIATQGASRGHEIKLKEDLYEPVPVHIDGKVEQVAGLFVISTHHSPADRVEEQVKWRTARRGRQGFVVITDHVKGNPLLEQFAGTELAEFLALKNANLKNEKIRQLFFNMVRLARLRRLNSLAKEHEDMQPFFHRLIGAQDRYAAAAQKIIARDGDTPELNAHLSDFAHAAQNAIARQSATEFDRILQEFGERTAQLEQAASLGAAAPFGVDDGLELFNPAAELIEKSLNQREEIFEHLLARIEFSEADDFDTLISKIKRFQAGLLQDIPFEHTLGVPVPKDHPLVQARDRYAKGWPAPARDEKSDPASISNLDDYVKILREAKSGSNPALAGIDTSAGAVRRALAIFLDQYFYDHLTVLTPRIWEGNEAARIRQRDKTKGLLDLLQQGKGASGQRFSPHVSTFVDHLGSSISYEEQTYLETHRAAAGFLEGMERLQALRMAVHLSVVHRNQHGTPHSHRNKNRKGNSLDYALQVLNLNSGELLLLYEQVKDRGADDPEKRRIVGDLLTIMASDPYAMTDAVFLGQMQHLPQGQAKDYEQLYPSSLPEDLKIYAALLARNREDLASDIESMPWLRPSADRYTPLAAGDLSSKALMRMTVLTSALFPGYEGLTTEDSLTADPVDAAGNPIPGQSKLGWRGKLDTVLSFVNQSRPRDYGESFWSKYDVDYALKQYDSTIAALRGEKEAKRTYPDHREFYETRLAPYTGIAWDALPEGARRMYSDGSAEVLYEVWGQAGKEIRVDVDGGGEGAFGAFVAIDAQATGKKELLTKNLPRIYDIAGTDFEELTLAVLEFADYQGYYLANQWIDQELETFRSLFPGEHAHVLAEVVRAARLNSFLFRNILELRKRIGEGRWPEFLEALGRQFQQGGDVAGLVESAVHYSLPAGSGQDDENAARIVGIVGGAVRVGSENLRPEIFYALRQSLNSYGPLLFRDQVEKAAHSKLDQFIFLANLDYVISKQEDLLPSMVKKIGELEGQMPEYGRLFGILKAFAAARGAGRGKPVLSGDRYYHSTFFETIAPGMFGREREEIDLSDSKEVLNDLFSTGFEQDGGNFLLDAVRAELNHPGIAAQDLELPAVKTMAIQQGPTQYIYLALVTIRPGKLGNDRYILPVVVHVSKNTGEKTAATRHEYQKFKEHDGDPELLHVLTYGEAPYRLGRAGAYASSFANDFDEAQYVSPFSERARRGAEREGGVILVSNDFKIGGPFEERDARIDFIAKGAEHLTRFYDADKKEMIGRMSFPVGDMNTRLSRFRSPGRPGEGVVLKDGMKQEFKRIAWRETVTDADPVRLLDEIFQLRWLDDWPFTQNRPGPFRKLGADHDDMVRTAVLRGFFDGMVRKYGADGISKGREWLRQYVDGAAQQRPLFEKDGLLAHAESVAAKSLGVETPAKSIEALSERVAEALQARDEAALRAALAALKKDHGYVAVVVGRTDEDYEWIKNRVLVAAPQDALGRLQGAMQSLLTYRTTDIFGFAEMAEELAQDTVAIFLSRPVEHTIDEVPGSHNRVIAIPRTPGPLYTASYMSEHSMTVFWLASHRPMPPDVLIRNWHGTPNGFLQFTFEMSSDKDSSLERVDHLNSRLIGASSAKLFALPLAEGGIGVAKIGVDEPSAQKLEKEAKWILALPRPLLELFPRIVLAEKTMGQYVYVMEELKGDTLSNLLWKNAIDPAQALNYWRRAFDTFLAERPRYRIVAPAGYEVEQGLTKAADRNRQVLAKEPYQDLRAAGAIEIDGHDYLNLTEALERVRALMALDKDNLLRTPYLTLMHLDLHLGNIMAAGDGKMIDPRGDPAGDPLYDVIKLANSMDLEYVNRRQIVSEAIAGKPGAFQLGLHAVPRPGDAPFLRVSEQIDAMLNENAPKWAEDLGEEWRLRFWYGYAMLFAGMPYFLSVKGTPDAIAQARTLHLIGTVYVNKFLNLYAARLRGKGVTVPDDLLRGVPETARFEADQPIANQLLTYQKVTALQAASLGKEPEYLFYTQLTAAQKLKFAPLIRKFHEAFNYPVSRTNRALVRQFDQSWNLVQRPDPTQYSDALFLIVNGKAVALYGFGAKSGEKIAWGEGVHVRDDAQGNGYALEITDQLLRQLKNRGIEKFHVGNYGYGASARIKRSFAAQGLAEKVLKKYSGALEDVRRAEHNRVMRYTLNPQKIDFSKGAEPGSSSAASLGTEVSSLKRAVMDSGHFAPVVTYQHAAHEPRVHLAKRQLKTWLRENDTVRVNAGRYGVTEDGSMNISLRWGKNETVQIFPEEAWLKKFPQLAEKLGRNQGGYWPPPGAFGQIAVSWTWNENRIAMVIDEIQPSKGFDQYTKAQRRELGAWKREVIRHLVRWAESQGILVLGTSPEVIGRIYRKIPPHIIQENYFESYSPEEWQLELLPVVHVRLFARLQWTNEWWVYKGNEEILRRPVPVASSLGSAYGSSAAPLKDYRDTHLSLQTNGVLEFEYYSELGDEERERLRPVMKDWGFETYASGWTGGVLDALVAYSGSEPVGLIGFVLHDESLSAYGNGIYVNPRFRRNPVLNAGESLMRNLILRLKDAGYTEFNALGIDPNDGARGLQAKMIQILGSAVTHVDRGLDDTLKGWTADLVRADAAALKGTSPAEKPLSVPVDGVSFGLVGQSLGTEMIRSRDELLRGTGIVENEGRLIERRPREAEPAEDADPFDAFEPGHVTRVIRIWEIVRKAVDGMKREDHEKSPGGVFQTAPLARVLRAVRIAGIRRGQTAVDWGHGFGDNLFALANLLGIRGIGAEWDPFTYRQSAAALDALKAEGIRGMNNVRLLEGDFHQIPLNEADMVFYFSFGADKIDFEKAAREMKPGAKLLLLGVQFDDDPETEYQDFRPLLDSGAFGLTRVPELGLWIFTKLSREESFDGVTPEVVAGASLGTDDAPLNYYLKQSGRAGAESMLNITVTLGENIYYLPEAPREVIDLVKSRLFAEQEPGRPSTEEFNRNAGFREWLLSRVAPAGAAAEKSEPAPLPFAMPVKMVSGMDESGARDLLSQFVPRDALVLLYGSSSENSRVVPPAVDAFNKAAKGTGIQVRAKNLSAPEIVSGEIAQIFSKFDGLSGVEIRLDEQTVEFDLPKGSTRVSLQMNELDGIDLEHLAALIRKLSDRNITARKTLYEAAGFDVTFNREGGLNVVVGTRFAQFLEAKYVEYLAARATAKAA